MSGNTPDPWLTEYFGTGPAVEETQEKVSADEYETLAALRLLEKNAAARGVDLSEYTPEDIVSAARELYLEGGQEKVAGEEGEEAALTPEQEFFQLHKFAGEIHAHAMVAELRRIAELEKEAEGRYQAAKEAVTGAGKRVIEAIKGAPGKAAEMERETMQRIGRGAGRKKGAQILEGASEKQKELMMSQPGARSQYEKSVQEAARKRGRQIAYGGAGAATALGGGGAAYAATRGKEKKSDDSAVEQLIQTRMGEMLYDAGWVDNDGSIIAPPEKTASGMTAEEFDAAVDQEAARRLIEDYGYPE